MDVNILRNFGDWTSVLPVFTRLAMMLSQGCGRAILDLEGGVNPTTNVDLWRDDVYDKTDKVPQVSFDFFSIWFVATASPSQKHLQMTR